MNQVAKWEKNYQVLEVEIIFLRIDLVKIKSKMDLNIIFTKGYKALDSLLSSQRPFVRKVGLGYKESHQNAKGESSSKSLGNEGHQIYLEALKGRTSKDESVTNSNEK